MPNTKYETVIGLEVHVELHTNSKIFCGCATQFGALPNTQTCPICLGHPGVLPVLNQQAVEYAIKAALALNCHISPVSKFDRKNYFYPDSPKAYQISQHDQPIGQNGWLNIEIEGKTRRIGIHRLHLEEDAGKLTHVDGGLMSLVDCNRVGTPLIEVVSEPVLHSPAEAKAYLEKLKAIMQYCDVSNVKMEEGSLRCDANISLRLCGQKELGTKTELKNMNSFRGVQRGLAYEVQRQAEVLNAGGKVMQQTRRWDEAQQCTLVMRSKEEAHDYRYFPDPDLVTLVIDEQWKARIQASLPELPDARKERFIQQYRLTEYDATVLTATKKLADLFEGSLAYTDNAKAVANWLIGELFGYMNANGLEIEHIQLTGQAVGEMIGLIEQGTISSKIAKTVFKEMIDTGKAPQVIVTENNWVQISDEDAIQSIVTQVMADHAQSVADYQAGKEKALGFLVGQVMKETKGKANPELVNQLLVACLHNR